MVLALALALFVSWWFLWGIFHLAGGPVHLLLAAALLALLWRFVAAPGGSTD